MTRLAGAALWSGLPVGMRSLDQWCLAGPDKAPYLVGPTGLYNASPVRGPWMSFAACCGHAEERGLGIGFILTAADPYVCVDMDVKDALSKDASGDPYPETMWTPQYALDFYAGIVHLAHSYTELSASRKGLHVWLQGRFGAGRRKKGIEIYSQERFIICTGNAISEISYHVLNRVAIPRVKTTEVLPIADGTLILEKLAEELGEGEQTIELVEVPQEATDMEIWERAARAENADKFIRLCSGNWEGEFRSQSEADMALMSMFAFYSKSNEQCRRMFRQTKLGARGKATKNNLYLDRTLKPIRARQAQEEIVQAHGRAMAAEAAAKILAKHREPVGRYSPTPDLPAQASTGSLSDPLTPHPRAVSTVTYSDQAQHTEAEPNVINYPPPPVEGLDWPPGNVGAIAGFIYRASPRPVKEISIVAALALVAGIVGKAYNIERTGLNLYIILVARSAVGKEAIHSGLGAILRSPCGQAIRQFVDFNEYVSSPALVKGLSKNRSFVNVSGEWGRRLQRMSDDSKEGPMQQLRTLMTHLYQKSGVASAMGGLNYSNNEQNIASVDAVAYSMIGESTPKTFYESLTSTMMEDGFLSRFNIVEYTGDRPAKNKDIIEKVPPELDTLLSQLGIQCSKMTNGSQDEGFVAPAVINVDFTNDAKDLLENFNLECDNEINKAGEDESIRQIWNRAHLKALRVAGILAVADNYHKPVVNIDKANWALKLINRNTQLLLEKINSGDIGLDDAARTNKFDEIVRTFLKGTLPSSYGVNPQMIRDRIIPRQYLSLRTRGVSSFSKYRLGSKAALDLCINGALEDGVFQEIPKVECIRNYNFQGRCFRILLDV